MVEICLGLSDEFINPHKHIFGGDYDANVIFVALQKKGYECRWLDKRKEYEVEEGKGLKGFLVNIEQEKKIYHRIFGFSARHWMAVCKEK